MRNVVILLIAFMIVTACTHTDRYMITGTVDGADSVMVFMKKRDAGKWINVDSAELVAGKFTFTGTIESPEMYYITVSEKNIRMPFFIENSDIIVTITVDSALTTDIKGSAAQDVYKEYIAHSEPINNEMRAIYKEYRKAKEADDEVGIARADSLYEIAAAQKTELIVQFAREHTTSVVAPYLILRNAYQFELPELEEICLVFDTNMSGSSYYDKLMDRVEILRSVQIGQPAPDFTQNDTAGNPLTLSSLKGKYLLVDFWASWCSPCRTENPNVVEAWKKYHKKGFDILGVSLDRNRDKWIEAIDKDDLTWNHVSDLQYWSNAAAKLYGVNLIPANVLLDPEGIIIGRNLKGADLQLELEGILGPAK